MIASQSKRCAQCNKLFLPRRPWQAYCSRDCGDRMRAKRRYRKIKKLIRQADAMRTGGK